MRDVVQIRTMRDQVLSNVFAAKANDPVGWRCQSGHESQQAGLTAAVWPCQQKSAACRHLKRQSRKDQPVSADAGQVFSRKWRGHEQNALVSKARENIEFKGRMKRDWTQ